MQSYALVSFFPTLSLPENKYISSFLVRMGIKDAWASKFHTALPVSCVFVFFKQLGWTVDDVSTQIHHLQTILFCGIMNAYFFVQSDG